MNVSSYISRVLVESGIVRASDIDICKYGLEVFAISVFEILSILIFSAFWGNFIETLLFFLAFVPLRMYAGGYHANSKLRCYLVLIITYALFTNFLSIIQKDYICFLNLGLIIFSFIVIMSLSPVVSNGKSVNTKEACIYRKISIRIAIVESIVILISTIVFPQSKNVLAFSLGQFTVTFSMVVAFVNNKVKRRCAQ